MPFFRLPKINAVEEKKDKPVTYRYQEQHAVIIKVETEREQKELFERLREMGFKNIKVVSV